MFIKKIIGQIRLIIIDIARGTNIRSQLKHLRKEQYLSSKEIQEIQESKFKKIFLLATEHTDYYKQYKNYESLPILTKDLVRKNEAGLKNKIFTKKLFKKGTSGSTGTPLVYFTTQLAQSFMWAGILLSWEVTKYIVGERVAFISGSAIIKSSTQHNIFYKLLNIKCYSTFTLNEENIAEYINDIKKRKTRLIYGYATALDKMASYIHKNQPAIQFPYLKGIVSSAEVLTEANRENIEKAFKTNVYNQYGCNEAGISAFECENKKMHLIATRSKYEIDHENNLLSTDLANEGFIMMRYFTGDKVIFSNDNSCLCRRNYPIIEKVIGRSYDFVVDMNKKVLHAAFFNILFRNDPTIKQFQVTYNNDTINICLNIDNSKPITAYDEYLSAIKKHLYFKEYHLVFNAPFLKAENAKHRYVINETLQTI
jgi:phenylacetate-CoA ligase